MTEQDTKRSAYDAVLTDLRAKKEQAIQEVARKYDLLIAGVEAAMTNGTVGLVLETTPAGGDEMAQRDSVETITIGVGEFHGMPYTNAARAILQKTNRRALKTSEILMYIERSGRKVEGKNPAGTIYSSLKRNQDFELVAPNTWGLAEWYGRKRRSGKGVAGRTEEIMRQGSTSFARAVAQAEGEAKEANEE